VPLKLYYIYNIKLYYIRICKIVIMDTKELLPHADNSLRNVSELRNDNIWDNNYEKYSPPRSDGRAKCSDVRYNASADIDKICTECNEMCTGCNIQCDAVCAGCVRIGNCFTEWIEWISQHVEQSITTNWL
jgi:hypothetical protein